MGDLKTVTVELETPIERGDQRITSLSLRKPGGGELRGLSMMDLARMEATAVAKILPRITVPPLLDHEITALDPADRFALATEIAGFFISARMMATEDPTTAT